ncbi:hypothetical protein KA005_04980 [bacterium]|nr:hypothetical protein [bacterium]
MEEEYWEEIEQDQERIELSEFNYADDYINQGYAFTLNRIISNMNGGRKSNAE